MPKLSVTVITKDEEENLARALESVSWADEIVVVDCGSQDGTTDVAYRFTNRVSVRPWTSYGDQKNHAAELASHDWIFSLDADERVSSELAAEILELIATEPAHRGYRVPRVAFHLGRWIRSTDWYPDFQLRLYDRRAGRWTTPSVHESVRSLDRLAVFVTNSSTIPIATLHISSTRSTVTRPSRLTTWRPKVAMSA